MPNSFEIGPEVFDKILECFLLVDKATTEISTLS